MNLSAAERLLLAATLLATLYRIAKDEWPIGLEIEETEGQ